MHESVILYTERIWFAIYAIIWFLIVWDDKNLKNDVGQKDGKEFDWNQWLVHPETS